MSPVERRTHEFEYEYRTASTIQRVVKERKGLELTLIEAHQLWAEHSDDYAAGWLVFSEEKESEILQALTCWLARHRKGTAS